MDLDSTQNNALAKLPLLKQGDYDTWRLRIESYIQLQDYALWEIIEEGNSFKPVVRTTTNEDGTSTTTITGAVTAEQKIQKKNDLKARSILMMTLPSEHLLTFNKNKDAKTLFEAIEARFGGEVIPPEELNLKFLRSLPSEWSMHVVVWRNKSDLGSISFDDLYNNFKIVEPEVKGSVTSSLNSGSQNLAFVSAFSSTNDGNTANVHVSTASTNNSTACLNEDLEQIYEDDLDEIDLKWQLALLSMKSRKFYQRTGKKIVIDGSDTAGYDKKRVECFNCHKLGHFARECRNPRSQENRSKNQDSSRRTVNVEESPSKAMIAIDGVGFDWSYMAEEEAPTNFALMEFSDSEVQNNKTCSKACLKNFEDLKSRYDKLRIEFNKSESDLDNYKRGLASVEEQLVFYKKNEGMLCDQIVVLKRDASFNESDIDALKKQVERLKKEKESIKIKVDGFENASKSLDTLIGSQIPFVTAYLPALRRMALAFLFSSGRISSMRYSWIGVIHVCPSSSTTASTSFSSIDFSLSSSTSTCLLRWAKLVDAILLSASAFLLSPLGTCLIENSLKVLVRVLTFAKYLIMPGSFAIPAIKALYSASLLVASNLNLEAYVNSIPSGFESIRPAPEPSMHDDPSVNNIHGSGSSSSSSMINLNKEVTEQEDELESDGDDDLLEVEDLDNVAQEIREPEEIVCKNSSRARENVV
ncbi:ribonuclease H-like domain-containing protein [Tanacetum coccineum]